MVKMLSEGQKTVSFFKDIPAQDWDRQIYTEGSCWTVRQILAHFVSAENGFRLLIQDALTGGQGSPEGFDIDHFNEREVSGMQVDSETELLRQFESLRQENAVRVGLIDPAQFAIKARHPFLGLAPLVEIIKLVYRHNQIHQRDIRKALRE
jgi:hypothetical protein